MIWESWGGVERWSIISSEQQAFPPERRKVRFLPSSPSSPSSDDHHRRHHHHHGHHCHHLSILVRLSSQSPLPPERKVRFAAIIQAPRFLVVILASKKKGFEKYEFSWFLEKNQIATFGLLTKHIGFFQKQKFMGLLYSEQEENIYINAVSSFPKIHALLQFLFQLLFDFWDLVKVNVLLWRNIFFW